jgi:hypothetical protein
MDNKKKITTYIILMAMVITLGSAVVATKMARDNEEVSTGDAILNEHRVDDVTVDGVKLVYKDNSVRYNKYVVLRYSGNTNKYTEDTYYWFNTDEEYQTNFRNLSDTRIDYNSEIKYVRTMSGIKEKSWNDMINELIKNKDIQIIR